MKPSAPKMNLDSLRERRALGICLKERSTCCSSARFTRELENESVKHERKIPPLHENQT